MMGICPACGGRGWHTAGGNDPVACGRCPAGEAWTHGVRLGGTAEPSRDALARGYYPEIERFRRWFGTRVRTVSAEQTSVWSAELHDAYDGYAFKLLATGDTEEDALQRLDSLLAEVRLLKVHEALKDDAPSSEGAMPAAPSAPTRPSDPAGGETARFTTEEPS